MDIVNRADLEEMLALVLGREFAKERKKLIELMGNPPMYSNIPESYWLNGGGAIRAAVTPVLEKIFLQQAAAQMAELSIGVDWALVNTGAIEWAREYSFELVKGITDTTRTGVRTALDAFYEGENIGQLIDRLTPYYGAARAEMIAITEVTRASARGEDKVINEILARNSGMERVDTWYTHKDDRVCTICGPMHHQTTTRWNEKDGSVWTHPDTGNDISIPAHPRCRCWKRTQLRAKA